jgi:ribonucleases P/MRP protein subunit RPP40
LRVDLNNKIANNTTIKENKSSNHFKAETIEANHIQTKSHLKCIFFNARSIVNKLDDLAIIATNENPDVIGIVETWLHKDIENGEISLEGYTFFRRDRESCIKTRGGGVLLYVKKCYKAMEVADENDFKSESIWVKIVGQEKKHIHIGVCYRTIDCSEEENNALFNSIRKYSENPLVIMGDFNYRDIDWLIPDSGPLGLKFLNLVNDCFLVQHVLKPTRGDNTLDLIFSTEENMVENLETDCPISKSDHCIIKFKVLFSNEIISREEIKYDYLKGNYNSIKDTLINIDWKTKFADLNTHQMWIAFKNELNEVKEQYIPRKVFRKKKDVQWMNKNVRNCIKSRNLAWKKYSARRDYYSLMKYKRERNRVVEESRIAKRSFESRLADKIQSDPKSFYAYMKRKQNVKDAIGPLKNDSGELVCDTKDICHVLNNFFKSVFTVEDVTDVPEVKKCGWKDPSNKLVNIIFNADTVKKALKEVKDHKSGGVDEFPSSFILRISEWIVDPLVLIFSSSFTNNEIPDDWKRANVTPLFKKGSKKDASNYRPISLTSQFGKILEKIIKTQISDFLENNKLIHETQHGFRRGKSCLTNLIEFSETISDYVDSGSPVDIIYLDFQKAFDKVSHHRLIKKLEAYDLSPQILTWLASWLDHRYQRVVIDGISSDWALVTSGVPQGSVLGPLLFSIYINDLDDGIIGKILKFADDTKIIGKVSTPLEIKSLQCDLDKLMKWSKDWLMPFNIQKCHTMHVGHNNPNTSYNMGGTIIEDCTEEKDLGIIVTKDFKVHKQCVTAANSGNRTLGMIKRTIVSREKDIIIKLYKSLVRPKLDYCIQAWRPHLQKDIDILEKIQKRALKLIPECKYKNYSENLRAVGLTTLETRRQRADLIEVYKIINNLDGINKHKLFKFNHRISRGNSFKMFKDQVRLDIKKFCFSNRVIGIWNDLPEDIVRAESVNVFKGKVDRYLKFSGGLL